MATDPYVDPLTGVLNNKRGISNQELLEDAERILTTLRLKELAVKPVTGRFDFNHLKRIHKYIFQDIYEWAGKSRTVEIGKEDTPLFCLAMHIHNTQLEIFERLKAEEYLLGLDTGQFAKRTAYYLGQINALHPFREGNGRAQREFIRQLARKAGYDLSWSRIAFQQERMIDASLRSMHIDDGELETLIREALS